MKSVKLVVLIIAGLAWLPDLQGAEVGNLAPELNLPHLSAQLSPQEQDEGRVTLAEHQGKIIYLDFWASWCPPCLVSMPIMNEMRNRLQSQGLPFEVIAVNVDSDPEDGVDFLLDKPVDFIVLADPDGLTPAAFTVRGMPTSFLINVNGTIEMRHEGFKRSDAELIENEILRLVEELP